MLIFILSRTQELWSPPSSSSQRFEHALNRLSCALQPHCNSLTSLYLSTCARLCSGSTSATSGIRQHLCNIGRSETRGAPPNGRRWSSAAWRDRALCRPRSATANRTPSPLRSPELIDSARAAAEQVVPAMQGLGVEPRPWPNGQSISCPPRRRRCRRRRRRRLRCRQRRRCRRRCRCRRYGTDEDWL